MIVELPAGAGRYRITFAHDTAKRETHCSIHRLVTNPASPEATLTAGDPPVIVATASVRCHPHDAKRYSRAKGRRLALAKALHIGRYGPQQVSYPLTKAVRREFWRVYFAATSDLHPRLRRDDKALTADIQRRLRAMVDDGLARARAEEVKP